MATTQRSPTDFTLVLPLTNSGIVSPRREVAIDEADGSGQKSRRIFEAVSLREIPDWELVEQGDADDALEGTWKTASKRIGEIAETLRQVVAAGNVLEGDARVISDNLTLIRAALRESRAGIRDAGQLPRVRTTKGDSRLPRAF